MKEYHEVINVAGPQSLMMVKKKSLQTDDLTCGINYFIVVHNDMKSVETFFLLLVLSVWLWLTLTLSNNRMVENCTTWSH